MWSCLRGVWLNSYAKLLYIVVYLGSCAFSESNRETVELLDLKIREYRVWPCTFYDLAQFSPQFSHQYTHTCLLFCVPRYQVLSVSIEYKISCTQLKSWSLRSNKKFPLEVVQKDSYVLIIQHIFRAWTNSDAKLLYIVVYLGSCAFSEPIKKQ